MDNAQPQNGFGLHLRGLGFAPNQLDQSIKRTYSNSKRDILSTTCFCRQFHPLPRKPMLILLEL